MSNCEQRKIDRLEFFRTKGIISFDASVTSRISALLAVKKLSIIIIAMLSNQSRYPPPGK